jgi:hypothetical protein
MEPSMAAGPRHFNLGGGSAGRNGNTLAVLIHIINLRY